HLQPPTAETGQIVAHALFSDAAAAVVVAPDGSGYELVQVGSLTDPTTADHMTWDMTDLGFRMGLSPRVPDVLAARAAGFVDGPWGQVGWRRGQVDRWAVHPGGPQILTVVERELQLAETALAGSRQVLAEHGNCSSPTVLLVLDRLRRYRPPRVVMMA